MQKITLMVLLYDKNEVLIPSSTTPQYTGVMDESSIYAKLVYGTGPLFIKVPNNKTKDATNEYESKLSEDFKIKELIFSELDNLENLETFSISSLEANILDKIEESIDLQNNILADL